MENYQQDILGQQIPLRWKYLNIIDYILPVYIVLSIPLFYFGYTYVFIYKGISILISLVYFYKFGRPKTENERIFTIFFFLVLFSFLQYVYNDRPLICYFKDASNYITSMLFFYIGVTDDRPGRTFYNKIMYATGCVFALGLICYVLTPSWYQSRCLDFINAQNEIQYSESNMFEQWRFGSFFGESYSVSHISVFCVAIAFLEMAYSQGKEKYIAIFCLIIGLFSSMASVHRASILGSAIAVVLYFYFNYKTKHNARNIKIAAIAFGAIACFIIISPDISERIGFVWEFLTDRVSNTESVNEAVGERKFTHEVMASMRFFFFGHGLGSCGVSVREYGFYGIADMQYIKMFYENGIIGAVLFIRIIFSALFRGIKYIRYYMTDVAIVLFILAAMLGSNSLSIYYLIVFPFWYAVGRLSNDRYFHNVRTMKLI